MGQDIFNDNSIFHPRMPEDDAGENAEDLLNKIY